MVYIILFQDEFWLVAMLFMKLVEPFDYRKQWSSPSCGPWGCPLCFYLISWFSCDTLSLDLFSFWCILLYHLKQQPSIVVEETQRSLRLGIDIKRLLPNQHCVSWQSHCITLSEEIQLPLIAVGSSRRLIRRKTRLLRLPDIIWRIQIAYPINGTKESTVGTSKNTHQMHSTS